MNRRGLLTFIGSLLVASWMLQTAALLFCGDVDSPKIAPWLIAIMFTPAVWSLAYLFKYRNAWRHVAWRPGRLGLLLIAPLIPAVVALAVIGITETLGWGESRYFQFASDAVTVNRGPWLVGLGQQSWLVFLANFLVTAWVYGVMNSVATIGEEFGWRGFLQHHLVEAFGIARGIALLGLVWAYWHLPIVLAGYNYPDYPVLGGLVLFPLLLIGVSMVMAWITIRAGSFWPAVLMHGSVNGAYQAVVDDLVVPSRLLLDVLQIALFAVLGFVCWLDLRQRVPAAASTNSDRASPT